MAQPLPDGSPERIIGAVPRRISSPIFVGRVAERAALSEALQLAAAGRPGIVLISGEAGVGKSRLLTEVATRIADAEEAVAAGRRFIDLFHRSARSAIEADGAGPLLTAQLRSVDAEGSRLEGRPDPPGWAAAVEARGELEQPWESVYARYRLAEAILTSGAPTPEAAAPMREAHAAASGLGAAPLRIAIEALATRARIQLVSDPGAVGLEATRPATTLTARELEVLALVAAGHTNREIGALLFISNKTVSVHVTHAMDKLGALSRYEAAASANRLGLLEPG